MRRILAAGLAAVFAMALTGALAGAAGAAEGEQPPAREWSFDGLFGAFDQAALQRGYQVYSEVCSGCHGVKYLAFRNLGGIGLSAADIKAIAAEYEVEDGPDDEGEMFTRPALPSDPLPRPYPNPQAARAANNGALPPDLSLITKARKGGPDYVYALLTGYGEAPDDVEVAEDMSYNRYFPGHQIAMPQPLDDDAVEYTDGTKATKEQMASDVTQFLMWAAEPNLDARKRIGVKTLLFLLILTVLFYASKRKVWAKAH
ncbi:MAG: cytochrome c1 [Alphaproteobacteria bacterium]